VRKLLFPLITTFLGLLCPTQADTFYVSKEGDDSSSGRAPVEAFLTISRGVRDLKAGDTLIVRPGVYREQVLFEKSGTKDRPITIKSEIPQQAELVGSVRVRDWIPVQGRRQVFKTTLRLATDLVYEKDTETKYTEVASLDMLEDEPGTFMYEEEEKTLYVHPSDDLGMAHHVIDACLWRYGIGALTTNPPRKHLPRSVGLVIDGFAVRDYATAGIFIRNADYCTIKNCVVHHCRFGIFTYCALRSRIINCESYRCSNRFNREQGNIAMMGYSFECLMEGNVVHHTAQHGIRFYSGMYDCKLRNNLAYDCRIGMQIKGQFFDHTKATRLARFSDDGNPNLKEGLKVICEGNVSLRNQRNGIITSYSVFRNNTTELVQAGRAKENIDNIALLPEETPSAGFVAPEWNDLRVQSDSRFRNSKDAPGAHPYGGDVFFASPAGNDEFEGTSTKRPWTLAAAAQRIKPGQTLYLLPGSSGEPLELKGLHSKENPIRIRARGRDGSFIFDGMGKLPHGIKLTDCEGIHIEGFRMHGLVDGIVLENSSGILIAENEIFDCKGSGVRTDEKCHDITIERNTFAFIGKSGIRIDSAPRSEISSNIFFKNGTQLEFPKGLPERLFADFNCLFGETCATIDRRVVPSLALWREISGLGSASFDGKPGFVSAERKDFRLINQSLCKGRGRHSLTIGPGRIQPSAEGEQSIENVKVVSVSSTTADLSWRVAGGRATMIVAYGTDPAKLENVIVRDTSHYYRTHHQTTLHGLKPGTRYYFRLGHRRMLEGPAPWHMFRYAWPERTPQGEQEYYETLKKVDAYDDSFFSFVTLEKDMPSNRVYHVSKQGKDSDAGSAKEPFLSVRRAAAAALPGDKVVVHEGVYHEMLEPHRSGLPGHPITFEAAQGERVVLDGKRETIPHGVNIVDRSHIVIRGFFLFGQSEFATVRGSGGQIHVIRSSDIHIERCVFDGRMNYVTSVYAGWSDNITVHNNIFVNHHASIIANDCGNPFTITRNSFLGSTLAKFYGPRNKRMIVRGNLFGEHLFPKKKYQYKLKLVGAAELDFNCHYFEPTNDERRIIDFTPTPTDLEKVTSLPEQQPPPVKRYGIKGTLKEWQQQTGQSKHSIIADPKWVNLDIIKDLRSRPRGWPSRHFDYQPFTRADVRVAENSPCKGAGESGTDIGPDY